MWGLPGEPPGLVWSGPFLLVVLKLAEEKLDQSVYFRQAAGPQIMLFC